MKDLQGWWQPLKKLLQAAKVDYNNWNTYWTMLGGERKHIFTHRIYFTYQEYIEVEI